MDNLKMGIGEGLFVLTLGILIAFWMVATMGADEERMSMEYCFDSNGDHYIAGSENCNH